MSETLAGVDIGKNENQIAVCSHDLTRYKIITIKGTNIYGKKILRDERIGDVSTCEWSRFNHSILLVLAIGEKCKERIKPGDFVTCPDDAPKGIMRSPYDPNDYFLDQKLLQLHIPRDKTCQNP